VCLPLFFFFFSVSLSFSSAANSARINEEQQRYITCTAHDLRTPLTVFKLATTMFKDYFEERRALRSIFCLQSYERVNQSAFFGIVTISILSPSPLCNSFSPREARTRKAEEKRRKQSAAAAAAVDAAAAAVDPRIASRRNRENDLTDALEQVLGLISHFIRLSDMTA
jgi:signal transduction histidine kinase